MMSVIPLLYLAEEENRRREQNIGQFFATNSLSLRTQAGSQNSDLPPNVALDKALLHILETGRFSDVQFLVGPNGYCFNCHKAIVGGRSEVLAIAMEQRWADNYVVPDKTVVRLPGTDVEVFKVFLKYLYSDELNMTGMSDDEQFIDLLLQVMSLAHMYQVEGLLKKCVTQLTPKINVRTCWTIHKESRLIAPSLSERSFQFLCDNIHEAAARIEYLKWDAETVRRILSLDRSFISELNLFIALVNWRKFPTAPLEPSRPDVFRESLLALIRFPTMNLATFTRVSKTNVFSQSEAGRLRRYITNTNPRRRNTSIYSSVPRFTDIHSFKLLPYQGSRRTSCNDDGWNSSDDNFMELIKSNRAEFSVEVNTPTTISSLLLHNAIRRSSAGIQLRFKLLITFYIYISQSVMYEEERSMVFGGLSNPGPLISFVLRQPFEMTPGRVYEFHVLYELLEYDEDMVDEYERYVYQVTWSSLSRLNIVVTLRIAHGIVFKINYQIEEEDDDENDHYKTPRWIHSVKFKSRVSHSCEQMCAVS